MSDAGDATGSRAATPVELLRRIREWDHLPLTGDGPYWITEIDKTLAAHATPDRAALLDFNPGDSVLPSVNAPGTVGWVVKVGRKYVTVRWEQPNGASWEKKHLPEWLRLG